MTGVGRLNSIPWDAIEPHRRQAFANTGQSLERLHERGGLAPHELYNVMHDRGSESVSLAEATDFLVQICSKEECV